MTDRRRAKVGRDGNGAPLGTAIFLGPDELAELGLDLTDAAVVNYWIANGELRIELPGERHDLETSA